MRWGILVVAVLMLNGEGLVSAQGTGGMGGGGGMNMQRPKRKLKKNKKPVLDPALNMVDGVPNSFEGQFLLRTQPFQQAYEQQGRTERTLDRLQTEITDTENQVKTGVKGGSGHRVRFLNYGNYYSFPNGRGGGGQ
jgi:hypothetical protein